MIVNIHIGVVGQLDPDVRVEAPVDIPELNDKMSEVESSDDLPDNGEVLIRPP